MAAVPERVGRFCNPVACGPVMESVMDDQAQRYVTLWRKPPPANVFEWDFHVSENLKEARTVVKNIKARGVHQYGTYPIGERVEDLSSEY